MSFQFTNSRYLLFALLGSWFPTMYLQVVVLALLTYYAFKWMIYRLKYDMHKVPSPPKLPILGHLHHLLRMERLNQNKFILEWYEKLNRPKVMLVGL